MDAFTRIVTRGNPNGDCTQSTCPVSESVYGYRPNLGATIFFLIVFALSGIVHLWQSIKFKTWFFGAAMVIGCISEVLGYVSKLILHDDPFSALGFMMSDVVLTFAPAFYSAGIYYTLKHICLTFSPSLSRLRPSWYTYIFIGCDLFSIILQAAGGATDSAAQSQATLDAGVDILITGLTTQVFTLLVFGFLAADYAWTVYRHRTSLNPDTLALRRSLRFRLFLAALTVAYLAILIRCCYRVAELAKGWGAQNNILRTQDLFICLDSVPCAIATVVLNIWHPGWSFPAYRREEMPAGQRNGKNIEMSSSEDEAEKGGAESS